MLTSVSYGNQAVVSKIKVWPFSSIMDVKDVMEDLVEHVDLLFKTVSTVLTQWALGSKELRSWLVKFLLFCTFVYTKQSSLYQIQHSYSIMSNKTEMLLQKTVSPHVVYGISTVGAMIPSLYLRTTEVILFVSFWHQLCRQSYTSQII